MSENLRIGVSARTANPTPFSAQGPLGFFDLIRLRSGLYGNHLFDVIPDLHRLARGIAEMPGPLELWDIRVPALSAYACQKASSSVLA